MTNKEEDYNIKAIIPDQFVGKFNSDDNRTVKVFYYLDVDNLELKKCFLERDQFVSLKIRDIMKNHCDKVYALSFITDEQDRENLVAVKMIGDYRIDFQEIVASEQEEPMLPV